MGLLSAHVGPSVRCPREREMHRQKPPPCPVRSARGKLLRIAITGWRRSVHGEAIVAIWHPKNVTRKKAHQLGTKPIVVPGLRTLSNSSSRRIWSRVHLKAACKRAFHRNRMVTCISVMQKAFVSISGLRHSMKVVYANFDLTIQTRPKKTRNMYGPSKKT